MSVYKMEVFGTCEFDALHCWPGAPAPMDFLRHPHRHLFKLKFCASVKHADRDIEFITLKQAVDEFCRAHWAGRDIGQASCETIGTFILDAFPEINSVTVSEDGENGATVWREV